MCCGVVLVEKLFVSLTSRSVLVPFLLCLLAYVPLIGYHVASSGYNPDEWRFAVGLETGFADVHMRWATHIGHNLVLGGQFHDLLHACLTFVPLYGISAILSARAIPDGHPALRSGATVMIFLAGACHVYLTEILHYQTLALWFTLGLFLSVLAQTLVTPENRSVSPLGWGLRILIAAELTALSLGFYQSYVFLGFIIPAMAMVRVDRFSNLQIVKSLLAMLCAAGVGAMLYLYQLNGLIRWLELEPYFRSTGVPPTGVLVEKAMFLPKMLYLVYGGSLLGTPHPFRGLYLLASMVALFFPLLAVLVHVLTDKTAKKTPLFRILLGSYGALVTLPMVVWFLYPDMFLVGRSIGYTGFVLAGIVFVNLGLIVSSLSPGLFRRICAACGLVTAAVLAANSVVASQLLWPVFRATHDRDVALADAIVDAAGQIPGFDVGRTPIRTVGGAQYDDLAFGSFINPSTFHPGVDMNSVFQVRFGAQAPAGSLPFSPRPCPAFPAPGSVFLSDETLFVCLEASDGPVAFDTCASFDVGTGPAAFCWNEGLYILAGQSCEAISLETGDIHVTLPQHNGSAALAFIHQVEPSLVNGVCMRPLSQHAVDVSDIILRRRPVPGAQAAEARGRAAEALPLDWVFGS